MHSVREMREAFAKEGKKLVMSAQGIPMVAGAPGVELAETIGGMSDDSTWGMMENSVPLTPGRQMAELAFNPVWRMSTLVQWGYNSSTLKQSAVACAGGDHGTDTAALLRPGLARDDHAQWEFPVRLYLWLQQQCRPLVHHDGERLAAVLVVGSTAEPALARGPVGRGAGDRHQPAFGPQAYPLHGSGGCAGCRRVAHGGVRVPPSA